MKSDQNLEIAKRAHAIWEQSGRPEGQAEQHWLQAERDLQAGNDNRAASGEATAAAANAKAAKPAPASKPAGSKKPATAGRGKQARAAAG